VAAIPGQPGQQPIPIPQPQQFLVQPQGENTGLFGSFFNKGQTKNMKGAGGLMKLDQVPATLKASGSLSDREKLETEVISNAFFFFFPFLLLFTLWHTELLLDSYFNIVKRTVADLIPKSVMLHLVSHARDNIQRELLSELYKSRSFEEVMKESEQVTQRRAECRKMIEALRRAEEAVSNV